MANAKQDPPRLRSFPKTKSEGGRLVLDREKVKNLYLDSPHYDFRTFCESQGFKYDPRKQEFPLRQWREEKVRSQIDIQDISILEAGMNLRGTILQNRIKSITRWDRMAIMARQIMEYKLITNYEAMEQDVQRRKSIVAGELQDEMIENKAGFLVPKIPYKFNISDSNAMMLGIALKNIYELEQRALLVPTTADQKSALGIPTVTQEERKDESEEERVAQMGWTPMNGNGLTNEEMGKIMSGWFDQLQVLPSPPEAAVVVDADNNPLTTVKSELTPEQKQGLELDQSLKSTSRDEVIEIPALEPETEVTSNKVNDRELSPDEVRDE